MEIGAKEILAVEQIVNDRTEPQIEELTSLQLSLIGGGVGEVLFG